MKVFLDDERTTPKGWHRTYTVEETIDVILQNNGQIEAVSLDNDLGLGHSEGYNVALWLEEQAFNNAVQPIPFLNVHSNNSSRREYMLQTFQSIKRFWPDVEYYGVDFTKLDCETNNAVQQHLFVLNAIRDLDYSLILSTDNGNTTKAQRALLRPIAVQKYNVGRNVPCPCGSGKKHKKCCLDT